MGWNGSSQANSGAGNSSATGSTRGGKAMRGVRLSHGLVAGAVVVVLAAGAWVFLSGREAKPAPTEATAPVKKAISEVQPAATNRVAEAKPEKKKYKDMTNEEKLKYYEDKYGDNLPENLKPVVYYLKNPPQQTFRPAPKPYDIFKRSSERTIAAMLLVEPGNWMMRAPQWGDKFDKDLAAALNETIEITKDDTEDQKALKEAVIATKAELAERIKAGEKGSVALNEAAQQLYELGQYRRDLEEQVNKIRRDANFTDDDVRDAVNAANQMLESKGVKPLKMPNMYIRHASLKQRAKRAAEKAAKEQSK